MHERAVCRKTLWAWACAGALGACTPQAAIPPNAIVSNNPCIDGILAEIAAPGQIGAVSIWSHDPASASAPIEWARRYPALGRGAEDVIAARPRLVLTGNIASQGTNAALAAAGIKTLRLGVPATLAESQIQIATIATAINQKAAGAALIARIHAATQKQAPGPGGPSALIWQAGGFVAGKGTIQDEMLIRAGFTNAAATYGLSQWDVLPMELLVRNPPAVIFMPFEGRGADSKTVLLRERLLSHLGNRVALKDFPDRLLFCAGPTIISAMERLHAARKALKP